MNSPLVCTFSVLDMAVLPKPWADYSKQFSQFIGQFLQTILERKKKCTIIGFTNILCYITKTNNR